MIPENEMGVIVLFSQQCEAHGFKIERIGPSFPDATISKDGQRYRAEFEFMAGSFCDHKHDVRECDLIICWENDCAEFVLPILALSDSAWYDCAMDLPSKVEREAEYWRQRAHLAESQLKAARRELNDALAGQKAQAAPRRIAERLDTRQAVLNYFAERPQATNSEAVHHLMDNGYGRTAVYQAIRDARQNGHKEAA